MVSAVFQWQGAGVYRRDHSDDAFVYQWKDGFHISEPGRNVKLQQRLTLVQLPAGRGEIRKIW